MFVVAGQHWESCLFPLMPMEEFVSEVRQPAGVLDSLGWRKVVKHVPFIDKPAASYGSIDPWVSAGPPAVVKASDWIYCSGWAAIPNEDRVPKSVLVSVGGAHQFIYGTRLVQSDWSVWIPAKLLGQGTSELFAWAFDDQKEKFLRLQGSKLVSLP